MTLTSIESGKTHKQENFPVASRLIHRRHRPIILAFYRFARAADDVADNSSLPVAEKLRTLEMMEQRLLGDTTVKEAPEAATLCGYQSERNISPQHALDLLSAFRIDVVKHRFADWNDLIS